MAGHSIMVGDSRCFIDYADGEGSAAVNGSLWRWEFHEYLGPTFLRKDGEPRKCQCPTKKAVWDAFEAWLKEFHRQRGIKKDPPRDSVSEDRGPAGLLRESLQG